MRVAMLTGGGDCPGLNAVMRAVARKGERVYGDELVGFLGQRGIHAGVHHYPLPLQPWFRGRGGERQFPNAIAHARTAFSLPIFPSLSDEDQGRVIAALGEWKRARAAAWPV